MKIVPNEKYPETMMYKYPTVEFNFYTIQWFNGTIKTISEHMIHQIKSLCSLSDVLE